MRRAEQQTGGVTGPGRRAASAMSPATDRGSRRRRPTGSSRCAPTSGRRWPDRAASRWPAHPRAGSGVLTCTAPSVRGQCARTLSSVSLPRPARGSVAPAPPHRRHRAQAEAEHLSCLAAMPADATCSAAQGSSPARPDPDRPRPAHGGRRGQCAVAPEEFGAIAADAVADRRCRKAPPGREIHCCRRCGRTGRRSPGPTRSPRASRTCCADRPAPIPRNR